MQWALVQIWQSGLEHAMGGRRLPDMLEMNDRLLLSSVVVGNISCSPSYSALTTWRDGGRAGWVVKGLQEVRRWHWGGGEKSVDGDRLPGKRR